MEWHLRNRLPNRFSYVDDEIEFPLKKIWEITLPGSIIDTPIYADSAIFVATTDELYKLNPATGDTLWTINTDASLQSSPAFYRNNIYLSSHTRNIFYCVDSINGNEVWRIDPGVGAGSCCFYDDNMYIRSKKGDDKKKTSGIGCYSLSNIKEVWFHACEANITMRGCAIQDGILVYGDSAGNVYGLNASNGNEIWKINVTNWIPICETKLGKKRTPHVAEMPIIVGNIVIISVDTPGQTFGLDLESGEVLWFYQANEEEKWNYVGQGIGGKNWYSITIDKLNPKHFYGVDINNGEVILQNNINSMKDKVGNISSKIGLVIGKHLFVGVYEPPKILAFDTNSGIIKWSHSVDRSNLRGDSRGIYADEKLIWVRNTGDVYCFE